MKNKLKVDYKIEKGIPIPARGHRGVWASLLNEMKEGDSIVLDSISRAHSFQVSARRKGVETTYRGLEDNKARVWRTN